MFDEKEFRDWYINVVRQFTYIESSNGYSTAAEALKSPEKATGFREIRAKGMAEAKNLVNGIKTEDSASRRIPIRQEINQ